ncbi:MAG: hypothetical protein AAB433_04175 [Nitrospirota bacterium]
MRGKIFSIFSLFLIPAVVLMTSLAAQSGPTDPEAITRMIVGHQKIEGTVIDMKSGLYTVKTTTGATLTLAEAAAVRHGHSVPKLGDEITLWVNEGNMVMDACPKGQPSKAPRFVSGTLTSIDNGKSQLKLSMMGEEKDYALRPENRMFRDLPAGAQVTIEVNDRGEVIDIHKDNK